MYQAFKFDRIFCKHILLSSFLMIIVANGFCFNDDSIFSRQNAVSKNKIKIITLQQRLLVFFPLDSAEYSIKLCADVPDNNNTKRVYKKGEPGHVFLILTKRNHLTSEVITRSFGFYPKVAVTFLIKQVRSKILDNSSREYDAYLEKKLDRNEFELVLHKCIELSKKKYNLKKYNCYDYAMEVFNSLPLIEKLPVTKIKFPFIFGKGGSPCSLYSDLQNLLLTGSSWVPYIKFGVFKSPPRDVSQSMMASF